ncbi:MAG: MATE family efflux transporter [Pseudomonadota bacterium]
MRHVAVMSLSASVGLVSIFLVDLVDLLFIALLDDPALTAAVGYAATLLYFTFAVTLGMNIACSALAARMIGQGDDDEARKVATSAIGFGIGVSVVIGGTVWLAAPTLLGWLGADGRTAEAASSYIRIILPAMPIATFGMMCGGLLRAHGDARRAMTVTLTAGAVNAILDPIFIFVLDLGLEGAAMASVCARIATAITALVPVVRHYGGFSRFSLSRLRLDLSPILGITVPAVLTNVATPVGGSIIVRAMSQFGDSAVAGYAVIGRLTPLAFCVIFALSGAVGPIIGQNFGAGQFDRVRGTLSKAMMFASAYTLLAWGLLMVLYGPIADWFKLSGEGRDLVFWYAAAVAPLFIFNGSLFISNAAFNNLKRPLWSTMLNWGKNTIGVAPFVVVGAHLGGAPGVLISQSVGGILFGVIGLWLAYRLVTGFENGTVDPNTSWRPSLMRNRAEPHFPSRQ